MKTILNVIETIKILFFVGNAISFLGIVMHVFGCSQGPGFCKYMTGKSPRGSSSFPAAIYS